MIFPEISGQVITEGVGILGGILTAVSMLPQVFKIAKEKKAEEVSIVMLSILLMGIAVWILYGILKSDLPIIFTNIFSFLVNVVLIGLRIKYKK